MDIAGLLDDMKERVRTRGATPFVGGGMQGSFLRGLLGLDPAEEATQAQVRAYQTGQALSNSPTPLALAAAPAAIVKAGKAAKARKVKPASDDVYEVMEANFNYGKLAGNKTMPIEKLSGGVRMDDPKEASRVKALAAKIASPEGYVSRLIVDDAGNVIEGQHRLEALRMLGDKDVPVTVIQDLSNKYNVQAMERAIEKTLHPDQVDQMVKRAIDVLEEAGSKEKALSQYQMPGRFKKTFEDAIAASSFKKPLPREEALETARKNAVEMLGLPESNTAMDRARAMGFNDKTYHGTFGRFENFDLSKANPRSQYMPGIFTADDPKLAENFGDYIMPLLQRKGTTVIDKRNARNAGLPLPEVDTIYDKAAGIRVTNKPENIRSRFAAFDPKRINDPDLLASLAAFGVGLPVLGLLAEEE